MKTEVKDNPPKEEINYPVLMESNDGSIYYFTSMTTGVRLRYKDEEALTNDDKHRIVSVCATNSSLRIFKGK